MNSKLYAQYLKKLLEKDEGAFFINGIFITTSSEHAVNLLTYREEGSGEVVFIVLDSGGGDWVDVADLEIISAVCSESDFEVSEYELHEKIQNSTTGCHELVTYIASRIAKIPAMTCIALLNHACESANGRILKLHQIPKEFNLMKICQSLSLIDSARQKIDDVNYLTNLSQKLERDLGIRYDPRYVDLPAAKVNYKLKRKNRNQLAHAKFALNHDYEKIVADILCLQELGYNNWREIVRNILKISPEHSECSALETYDKFSESELLLRMFVEFLSQNKIDDCIKMIADGFDMNRSNFKGEKPLIMACRYAHFDVVKYMLDKGADPNIKDSEGNTALIEVLSVSNTQDKTAPHVMKQLFHLVLTKISPSLYACSNDDDESAITLISVNSDPFYKNTFNLFQQIKDPAATSERLQKLMNDPMRNDDESTAQVTPIGNLSMKTLSEQDRVLFIKRQYEIQQRTQFSNQIALNADETMRYKKLRTDTPM